MHQGNNMVILAIAMLNCKRANDLVNAALAAR
jgi:hypothetical protein